VCIIPAPLMSCFVSRIFAYCYRPTLYSILMTGTVTKCVRYHYLLYRVRHNVFDSFLASCLLCCVISVAAYIVYLIVPGSMLCALLQLKIITREAFDQTYCVYRSDNVSV